MASWRPRRRHGPRIRLTVDDTPSDRTQRVLFALCRCPSRRDQKTDIPSQDGAGRRGQTTRLSKACSSSTEDRAGKALASRRARYTSSRVACPTIVQALEGSGTRYERPGTLTDVDLKSEQTKLRRRTRRLYDDGCYPRNATNPHLENRVARRRVNLYTARHEDDTDGIDHVHSFSRPI